MGRGFVITNPMIAENRSAEVTLSKLLRVLAPSHEELSVIGGNLTVESDVPPVILHSFPISRAANKLRRMADVFFLQWKMAGCVLKQIDRSEAVYFWLGDKMLLPYLAAKWKGANIHYFLYGNVEKEENAGLFLKLSGKLIRFMAQHAQYVCVESPSVLTGWEGLRPKGQKVIHLYTEKIAMNPIENRENVVGMLCRLATSKRVLESMEAFSQIHESYPDWRLEIIGSGKLEGQCREKIAQLNAENYIILHGWVEHSRVSEITQKWKLLLFPTDYEGLPNGLIEMMGQGIPALASPVGGILDIIVPGENGWFLEDNSVKGIEAGLRKAVADDSRIAENAYHTIAKTFTFAAAQEQAAAVVE